MNGRTACLAAFVAVIGGAAFAEDWPKWRGPRGDAIVREEGLAQKWPAEMKPLWTAKVGIGYSAPVAKDGKVYLLSYFGDKDFLLCFDADTGKELWRELSGPGWVGSGSNAWPGSRGSPTIDGDRIYTYSGRGVLMAHRLTDGKPDWQINIIEELKARQNGWGCASTPLVIGDAAYVQGGKGGPVAACVNTSDGTIRWRSQAAGAPSYAGAIQIEVDGVKQLIVFGAKDLIAMNPETGKTIWSYPWPTNADCNAATPIYHDGRLFITSGYKHGSLMLKVSKDKAERVWESGEIMGRFVTPILDAGYLYGTDENGTMRCLNWTDGKVEWEAGEPEQRLGMGGSYIRWGEKLITLSDKGTLSLIKATPQGREKISEMKAFQGARDVWTLPLVYNGKLYVKGGSQFSCYDISAKTLGVK